MAKPTNDYMIHLHEELKKTDITEGTADNYIRNLYTLNNKKPFTTLVFLKHKNQIEKALQPYANSTKKTFLASIVAVLSLVKDKRTYGKLYRDYQELMNQKVKEENDKPKNVKTQKQTDNWISWDEIKEIKSNLHEKVEHLLKRKQTTNTERKDIADYFILSLYTDLPPRRNQDYQLCYIVKSYHKDLPSDKNYLAIDDDNFIFNAYKTSKKYGQQQVSFKDNDSFKEALKICLKHHPLKPARYGKTTMYPLLTKPDGSPLTSSNAITRILNGIFKKKVGSSMLRHIYLTNKYGDKLDEMKEDSKAMGHSIQQQKEYIKNVDAKEEPVAKGEIGDDEGDKEDFTE